MILLYHKVAPETPTMWWISVDAFDKQMADLQSFDVVPLDAYDPENPRHAVITFDGVYDNVYRYALPILKKWAYPFELFIIGAHVGGDNAFDTIEPLTNFASFDQLMEMEKNGGRLQWHSVSHQRLDGLSDAELQRELTIPLEFLSQVDRTHFRWFAYPHGDHSEDTVAAVKACFDGALSCEAGTTSDRYQLNRMTVVEESRFTKSSVAIIVANYNYKHFISEAIESVLAQTMPADEILVIDDCSSDGSEEVISRYASRICFVRNEQNLGIVENFKKAVALTSSTYVAILGADNRMRSDYVERCKTALDKVPEVGVVYTDMLLFGPRAQLLAEVVNAPLVGESTAERSPIFLWRFKEPTPETLANFEKLNFIHGSSMFRRQAYDEVGGYRGGKGPEDHDLFKRMLGEGWHAARCPHPLIEYRQHGSGQANTVLNLQIDLAHWRTQAVGLNQTLSARDQQIGALNQKIEEVSVWAKSVQALVSEREERLNALSHKVVERDQQIGALNQKIEEVSVWAKSVQALASERDEQLNVLNPKVAERDRQIGALNRKIEEVSVWAKSVQAMAFERDEQLNVLTKQLVERDEQLTNLNKEIAQWHTKAVELSDWAVKLRDANALQQNELIRLSDWGSQIEAKPLTYAFKKYLRRLARPIFRRLPLSSDLKQRIRNQLKAIIRRRRHVILPAREVVSENILENVPASSFQVKLPYRDVFVFSVIDWHFRIQRPQQLARSLAKAGRRVFFFSNHFVDADEPGYQIEQLDSDLPLYQIKLHIRGAPAIYFAAPTAEAEAMLEASIARLIMDFAAISSISLVQHAYWYPLVWRLPNTYRIYDCMDHHEGFGNVPAELIDIERGVLKKSDLVIVTSSWLEDFAGEFNSNLAVVRNAVDFEHFSVVPEDIYRDFQQRKIIGYYGAIAEWFDIDLIRAVAVANPAHLILLVGNDTVNARSALRDLDNVLLTGEVSYAQLPFYLHAFDVCILPFKVVPLTLATNPVKLYEYLSAGKPVISVDLPEIARFGNLVQRAQTTDEFTALIANALKGIFEGDELPQARIAFAAEQTWDHRISELNLALKRMSMPKISVIILTFNNLDLTRNCLQSVINETDYLNLEVIIVDNASTDDTRGYLEGLQSQHLNLTVIFNDRNFGFAAGNNVGLIAATGDYLVLLNNDTVVTRGWALTLMRHLQADPTIGLIGPVTNNIGNEARIETSYKSASEMEPEVFRYTLGHMGQNVAIKTVAFFCAMMPRSTYELCGLLCEDYGLGFFEDDDYCRRIEALGMHVVCAEDVFIHHHLSASFNQLGVATRQALMDKNKAIYEEKWGKWTPHSYR